MLVQKVYPAQVVEYSLGRRKKSSLEMEDNDKHKVKKLQIYSHLANPKQIIINMTRVSEILMKSSQLTKSMMVIEDHISHQIGTVMTTGPGQDHQMTAHTWKDIDMRFQIEGIDMIVIQEGQIVFIIIN